jgi:hypothetical protein
MADNAENGNGGLYFIVGALLVAVVVIGFFAFGGSLSGNHKVDVTIEPPKASTK